MPCCLAVVFRRYDTTDQTAQIEFFCTVHGSSRIDLALSRGNCITDCALECDAVLGRSGSEGRLVAVLLADPLSTELEVGKEQWVKEILTWSSACSSSSSSSRGAGGATGDGGGRALLIRYVSIKLPKNKRKEKKIEQHRAIFPIRTRKRVVFFLFSLFLRRAHHI